MRIRSAVDMNLSLFAAATAFAQREIVGSGTINCIPVFTGHMKYKILLVLVLCAFFVAPIFADFGPITVNCAEGQSLNGTLSKLNKLVPTTVFVKGTCTEYVTINGFTGLTLIGRPGAALQQPSTSPTNGLGIHHILIEASQRITIDGFAVHSNSSALGAIGIGRNSVDVQLREHLSRVKIRRPVVDDDDFSRRSCLALHAVERVPQRAAQVVAGNDGRDRLPGHAPVHLSHQPYTVRSGSVTRQLIDCLNASTSATRAASAVSRFERCRDD